MTRPIGLARVRLGRPRTRWIVVGALAAMVTGVATVAWGLPPPPDSEDAALLLPYAAEISAATNDGVICCDVSDGTAVDARPNRDGWEIRFRDRSRFPDAPLGWVRVPEDAVLRHWRNPSGIPIVWWMRGGYIPGGGVSPGRVRCFAPPGGV